MLYTVVFIVCLTFGSVHAINTKKDGSFIGLAASHQFQSPPPQDEAVQLDALPESGAKGGKGGVLKSLEDLFSSGGKTKTKVQNNMLVLDLEDYKNIRNKRELELSHLQVQKSSDLFTNNTDKGVLHFSTTKNALKNKGRVERATLKLRKLFDAKPLGFKCTTNAVKLYLVAAPDENLKLKVLKGPIKMEFKKDEVEADVTQFFDDLEDDSPSSKPILNPNSMEMSYIELTRSTEGDDELDFDEEHPDNSRAEEEGEDDFFGSSGGSRARESSRDSPAGGEKLDKYVMLEADPNCYFAFDVKKVKPKVKLDMTKNLVFKIKGTNKGAYFGGAGLLVLVVGFLAFYLKNKRSALEYSGLEHQYEFPA